MNSKFFSRLGVVAIFLISTVIASSQDGPQTRSITSDDFASKRPTSDTKRAPRKRVRYNRVRVEKNVTRKAAPNPKQKPKKEVVIFTEIGVTTWKLRRPEANESGYMFSVTDENDATSLWLAERVGADDLFKAGDKVRFAIESSVAGYLYVFDRETNADGSLGDPYLIFPESMDDDNAVGPGMIADIPDQQEDMPYFNMNPKKADYTGELLTVILSPKKLSNLVVNSEGKLLNPDILADMESDSEIEIFSRTDADDKIYSKTESKSACGVKTRQLERVKSAGKPCGTNSTRLTPDEPLPQAIYRIKSTADQPAVAFVKLAVR